MSDKPTVDSLLALAREDFHDPGQDLEGETWEDHAENFIEGHLEILIDDKIIDHAESDRLWVGVIGKLRP